MTRGQLAIIFNGYNTKKISLMTSIEFNGDMYLKNGHGEDAIKALKNSVDVATYQYEVAKFNKDHHHYNDCECLTYQSNGDKATEMLDFTQGYFNKWFSDYVYLKNLTQDIITIKTEKWDKEGKTTGTKEIELQPNAIVVLCFGKLEKKTK